MTDYVVIMTHPAAFIHRDGASSMASKRPHASAVFPGPITGCTLLFPDGHVHCHCCCLLCVILSWPCCVVLHPAVRAVFTTPPIAPPNRRACTRSYGVGQCPARWSLQSYSR